jgi:hypothetical protein
MEFIRSGKWSVNKISRELNICSCLSCCSPRAFVEDVRRMIESVSLESKKDCETLLKEHEEHILSLSSFIGLLEAQKTTETMRIISLYNGAIRQRESQYTIQEEVLRHQLVVLAEEKAAAIMELELEKSYKWKQQMEAADIELKEKDQWQKNRAQRVTDYVLGGAEKFDAFTANAESILSASLSMHTLLRTRELSWSSLELISIVDKIWASNNTAETNVSQMDKDQKNILTQSRVSDENAKRAKDAEINESRSRAQASSLELRRKLKSLNGEFEERSRNFEREIAQLKQVKDGIVEKLKARKGAHIQDISAACANVIFQLKALMNHLECTAKCLRSFSGVPSLETLSNLAEAMLEVVKSTKRPPFILPFTILPPPKLLSNTTGTEPTSKPTSAGSTPPGSQTVKFTFPMGLMPVPAPKEIGVGHCEKAKASFKATENEKGANTCDEGATTRLNVDGCDRQMTTDASAKVNVTASVDTEGQEWGRRRKRGTFKARQEIRELPTSTPQEIATPNPSAGIEGWWRDFQFRWNFLASEGTIFKLPPQRFIDVPWPIIPPPGVPNFRNGSTKPDKLLGSITEMNVKSFIVESASLSSQTQRARILTELARYQSDCKRSWLANVKYEEKELVEKGCDIVVRILEVLKEKCPRT